LCRIIRHLGSGIHLNSDTGWKNFIKHFRPVVVSTASARLCIRPSQTIETSLLSVVRAPGDRIPRLPPFCRRHLRRPRLPFPLRRLVCCTVAASQLRRFSVFHCVPQDCERPLNGSSAQSQMSLLTRALNPPLQVVSARRCYAESGEIVDDEKCHPRPPLPLDQRLSIAAKASSFRSRARISARSSSVGIGILAMFTFTAGWFHPCSCAALLTTSLSFAAT